MSRTYVACDSRKFGVEIECGIDGGPDTVARLFDFPFAGGFRAYEHEGWQLGADGSGVELTTPPLRGKMGFQLVRQAMEKLKGAGAFVTTYDGLHIHHNAPEFVENPRLCIPLVQSWMDNRDAIWSMVAPRRRQGGPCPAWRQETFDSLVQWMNDHDGTELMRLGRYELNISSLIRHGTIEVRLHEGTLDADVSEAWIQFGQKFIYEVIKNAGPLTKVESDRELLTRLKLSPEAMATLDAKKIYNYETPGSAYRGNYSRY